MLTYNTIVVLAGAALLGLLCGVVGSFGVLRRRALLGDVLAHATLPGIALAFLLTHTKSLPVLLTGALATGLFGLACLTYLHRHTRTKDDAGMGIVLAVLFGLGIVLSRIVQNTSTDAAHSGLDSFILGKTAGMVLSDVMLTIGICAVSLVIVAVLFKEFRLVCFDAGFAQSLGWRVVWVDFAILAMLALAVVTGLPMVGVVMIAALTIIPPVAARLWVNGLKAMLILAAVFGVISACVGVLVSASSTNLPSGPLIVLSAAVVFVLSALFAPGRGLVASWVRLRRLRMQHGISTLTRQLGEPAPQAELADRLRMLGVSTPHRVLALALEQGFVETRGELIHLTDQARQQDPFPTDEVAV